jgi:DNA polymerase-3 subunit epsilon
VLSVIVEPGFAVVDLETTGLSPGRRDRVVEIGVVHVDAKGCVTGEWSTLVNPGRDVGPTSLHGLRPRDLVDAPSFAEVAAELTALLAGRVLVAHNLPFDARFLLAEYTGLGYPQAPVGPEYGVCTMRLATRYLPYAPRALADCCTAAGWRHDNAHAALADAHAAARLLGCYLEQAQGAEDWLSLLDQAPSWPWPSVLPVPGGRCALRREQVTAEQGARAVTGADAEHFLARLVPSLPRVSDPMADSYLAVLDDVLADRKVDAGEEDALVDLAGELGLDRAAVEDLHRSYLTSLARAAWEDGVVTHLERGDLEDVAVLLGLPVDEVERALEAGRTFTRAADMPGGSLSLAQGDRVCFTGQMSLPREDLAAIASQAGLCVTGSVSKKTTFLVCADADSMSGKARKAREVGTIVISEVKFHHLLAALREQGTRTNP